MTPRQRDHVFQAGSARRWAEKREQSAREHRLIQKPNGDWYDPEEK